MLVSLLSAGFWLRWAEGLRLGRGLGLSEVLGHFGEFWFLEEGDGKIVCWEGGRGSIVGIEGF